MIGWQRTGVLTMVCLSLTSPSDAQPADARAGRTHWLVYRLDDRVGVPRQVLARAERRFVEVFAEAGVALVPARSCPNAARAGGTVLLLTILPDRLFDVLVSQPFRLGFTAARPEQQERSAYVSFGRSAALADATGILPGTVLGHVLVHEAGHVLLPGAGHTDTGIMRAHWSRRELVDGSRGHLRFSPEQAAALRAQAEVSVMSGEACRARWQEEAGIR